MSPSFIEIVSCVTSSLPKIRNQIDVNVSWNFDPTDEMLSFPADFSTIFSIGVDCTVVWVGCCGWGVGAGVGVGIGFTGAVNQNACDGWLDAVTGCSVWGDCVLACGMTCTAGCVAGAVSIDGAAGGVWGEFVSCGVGFPHPNEKVIDIRTQKNKDVSP